MVQKMKEKGEHKTAEMDNWLAGRIIRNDTLLRFALANRFAGYPGNKYGDPEVQRRKAEREIGRMVGGTVSITMSGTTVAIRIRSGKYKGNTIEVELSPSMKGFSSSYALYIEPVESKKIPKKAVPKKAKPKTQMIEDRMSDRIANLEEVRRFAALGLTNKQEAEEYRRRAKTRIERIVGGKVEITHNGSTVSIRVTSGRYKDNEISLEIEPTTGTVVSYISWYEENTIKQKAKRAPRELIGTKVNEERSRKIQAEAKRDVERLRKAAQEGRVKDVRRILAQMYKKMGLNKSIRRRTGKEIAYMQATLNAMMDAGLITEEDLGLKAGKRLDVDGLMYIGKGQTFRAVKNLQASLKKYDDANLAADGLFGFKTFMAVVDKKVFSGLDFYLNEEDAKKIYNPKSRITLAMREKIIKGIIYEEDDE